MWKLRMHFYRKQVAKETNKSLNVTCLLYKHIIWIWRVKNQVIRQVGEYKICLASMKSKSLASLASMDFSFMSNPVIRLHLVENVMKMT